MNEISEARAVSEAIIKLMNGVVYQESHPDVWRTLTEQLAPVNDHFHSIGVRVIFDETEGYAFLRSLPDSDEDPLPRLVRRRSLTYHVSLLLLLLRGRLAEFETTGSEGKLVLEREQMVEMLRVFLAESSNEARIIDQVDSTISHIVKLGFIQELKGQNGAFEVKRIVKAYIDAETMSDFAGKLAEYAGAGTSVASANQAAVI